MKTMLAAGQANWRLAEMETSSAKDAVYLCWLGFLVGIAAGIVISVFRLLKGEAYNFALAFTALHKNSFSWLVIWFLAVIAASLFVGYLIKEPAIRYGGAGWIGDAILTGQEKPWKKILFPKFFGSLLVLSFGISVGSEGPSIQMGAATADGLKKFDSKQAIERKFFILGGCAAGLAAAFSAPFTGICYVFEIMNEKLTKSLFVFLLAGSFGVYTACSLIFNLDVMLPIKPQTVLDLKQFWLLIPLAVFASITGICYNYLLRWFIAIYNRQKIISVFWLPFFPFLGAGILMLVYPIVTGEGLNIASHLEQGNMLLGMLFLFLAAKLFFTAFCYGSGIPAGLMVPILCLGAVSGAIFADIGTYFGVLSGSFTNTAIILGMVGSFASAERAPVTGFALVSEMTGAFSLMPEMLFVAAISTLLARIAKIKTI